MVGWDPGLERVVRLPSGRTVRGRSLRGPLPSGAAPDYGLYLAARRPEPQPWQSCWIGWPDFWIPSDPADAAEALTEAWRRTASQRVEIGCGGGRGRTGTALACLAILDGVPPAAAVGWVRRYYHPRAVETPWQAGFVRRFPPRR